MVVDRWMVVMMMIIITIVIWYCYRGMYEVSGLVRRHGLQEGITTHISLHHATILHHVSVRYLAERVSTGMAGT